MAYIEKIFVKSSQALNDTWSNNNRNIQLSELPKKQLENARLTMQVSKGLLQIYLATNELLDSLESSLHKAFRDKVDLSMITLKSDSTLAKINERQARKDVRAKSEFKDIIKSIEHYKHHLQQPSKESTSAQRLLCLRSLELIEFLNEELLKHRRGAFQDLRTWKESEEEREFRKTEKILEKPRSKIQSTFNKVALIVLTSLISTSSVAQDGWRTGHQVKVNQSYEELQEDSLSQEKKELDEMFNQINNLIDEYNRTRGIDDSTINGLREQYHKRLSNYEDRIKEYNKRTDEHNKYAQETKKDYYKVKEIAKEYLQTRMKSSNLKTYQDGRYTMIQWEFKTFKKIKVFASNIETYFNDCYQSCSVGNERSRYLKSYQNDFYIKTIAKQIRSEVSSSKIKTLQGRVDITKKVIKVLNNNFTYIYDWKDDAKNDTRYNPYVVPMKKKSWDIMKSPSQMMIDGGGDCDEFSSFAVLVLNQIGIPAYYVSGTDNGQGHAIIGIQGEGDIDTHGWIFNSSHFKDSTFVLIEPQNPDQVYEHGGSFVPKKIYDINGNVVWNK